MVASDLCVGCKRFREIDYVSPEGQPWCKDCSLTPPLTSNEWAMMLLMAPDSPFGPPFKPGDKVEARTAGVVFDGVGEVTHVHFDLEHGGTPVYPTFRVVFSEKAHDKAPDEAYYTEVCLTKVG